MNIARLEKRGNRRGTSAQFRRVQRAVSGMARPTAEGMERRLLFAGNVPTVLSTFDGTTDGSPQAGVIVSGGMIYGTTTLDGGNDDGTVFSMPVAGGNPDLIAGFNGSNGHGPLGSLLLVNSVLYGTTYAGGANNDGVVFSVPVTGGDPTVLATFNGANGSDPESGLIVADNVLYGTTYGGGANGMGEVFSLPLAGGTVTVLASFNGTDGENPSGTPVLLNGVLYGNTHGGGANSAGVVYSLPITGGNPTLLANMDTTSGTTPQGPLVVLNNTLYGTATAGGANAKGTVFSLPIAGGLPTVLFAFDGTHGAEPYAGLIAANGILYATTAEGGANNDGALIGMFPAVSTPQVLASLNTSTGYFPLGTIAISNGVLYTAPQDGGTNNVGTVVSVNTAGTDTLVFNAQPQTTTIGVTFGEVTVFTLESDGNYDPLSTATVQISIANGPAGAVLSGNTIAVVNRATAIFDGLSVNMAGTYTLLASDIGDSPGTSSSFEVDRDDALAFTSTPTTAVADSTIGTVVVQVNTPQGAIDSTFNDPVTVTLSSLEQGPGALSGTTTVNAVNGVATFAGLSINAEGTYALQAYDDSADQEAYSLPVTITHDPSKLAVLVELTKSTIRGALLPGERAAVTLTFNNTAGSIAKGVMAVQLYIGDSRSADDNTLLPTTGLGRVSLNLAPGKTKKVTTSFVVPSLADQQIAIFTAVLTPVTGFSQPSLPAVPVTSDDLYDSLAEIGTVDGHANTRITESIGGVPVRLSMTGPGMASLVADSNNSSGLILSITGTTAASSITASASSGFAIDAITADGVLNAINAPLLNVSGGINLPSGAKTIRLGNLNGSAFTMGGFSPASITLGNLVDSSLITTAPLRSLSIGSFSNSGTATSIQAGSITTFSDKGIFAGNLATTGNLGPVVIRGSLAGDILAGTDLGADHLPGGGDDVFNSGIITSVHVFGGVTGSLIGAGIYASQDDFTAGNFYGSDTSKIGTIRIDGALSSDSKVLAIQLPAKAIVGGQPVATANDPRFVALKQVAF